MKRRFSLGFLIILLASLLLGGMWPVEATPQNGEEDNCKGAIEVCWPLSDLSLCSSLPGYAMDGWECFGSSCPSPYCSYPWSKVSFKCEKCRLIGGGSDCYRWSWLTVQYGTECYSGDVCSSDPGGGWITAGHCGSGGCWYGGIYKRCCSGTQFTGNPKAARCWVEDGVNRSDCNNPSACSNQYGNGYAVCTTTQGWDTCKTCTCGGWTPQACGGWTCADAQRHQTRSCNPSGCDSENRCVADVTCNPGCDCTAWVDQSCGPAGGCAGTEMYQTRSCNPAGCDDTTRCASDPDCGGSECSVTCGLPCCPGAWWGGSGDNCGRCGCADTESAQCNSEGTAWNCVSNPGLCGGDGPEPEYHKECSGGTCVTFEGAGSDQCSSDAQCRHYYCSGSGLSATCKLSLSPGSNECTDARDCQPPACNGTFINGGADYTSFLNVTLTLNAYNADQMRFRNQNLAWSGWESYATVKSWTLSAGADGTRSVTAQYKNDQGTSVIEAACTGSIILDTTPPISSMTPLPAWSTTTPVALSWSGSDNIAPAGELKYWLQYNIESGDWIDLAGSQTLPTSNTSYDFVGEEGTLYCFRVRARDPAGLWEDWPLTYDTCTSIDAGIEMYGFGWEFGDATPDVWVSVFDGVSGINYSALQCWYSSNGGVSWTARACNYLPTDPTTVSMLNVPFTTQSTTQNKARFRACDVAGSCLTNTYTVDNRTTGAWVQTFGGDIHGNSRIQLREAP